MGIITGESFIIYLHCLIYCVYCCCFKTFFAHCIKLFGFQAARISINICTCIRFITKQCAGSAGFVTNNYSQDMTLQWLHWSEFTASTGLKNCCAFATWKGPFSLNFEYMRAGPLSWRGNRVADNIIQRQYQRSAGSPRQWARTHMYSKFSEKGPFHVENILQFFRPVLAVNSDQCNHCRVISWL